MIRKNIVNSKNIISFDLPANKLLTCEKGNMYRLLFNDIDIIVSNSAGTKLGNLAAGLVELFWFRERPEFYNVALDAKINNYFISTDSVKFDKPCTVVVFMGR